MASSNFEMKLKKIFGVKSKKTSLTSFNRGYSQGFSNRERSFADSEKQSVYDEVALGIRLYVVYVEKIVRKHYEKNYDLPMARSKTMIAMSHYGIDRLAKKFEKFREPEKITELEEETKIMCKELGIQSPLKSIVEFSNCKLITI